MQYPETIKDLIECFSKLPSIGNKTAERLALSTIDMPEEYLDLFAESLGNIMIFVITTPKKTYVQYVVMILEIKMFYVL